MHANEFNVSLRKSRFVRSEHGKPQQQGHANSELNAILAALAKTGLQLPLASAAARAARGRPPPLLVQFVPKSVVHSQPIAAPEQSCFSLSCRDKGSINLVVADSSVSGRPATLTLFASRAKIAHCSIRLMDWRPVTSVARTLPSETSRREGANPRGSRRYFSSVVHPLRRTHPPPNWESMYLPDRW